MTDTTAAASPLLATPESRARFFRVFPSIMLPMFLASLDQTIVATALPAISVTVKDVSHISWVVVAYLVTTTISAPIYGKLGDTLGRKRVLFIALLIFIIASMICAAARDITILTIGRLFQGMGGGGLMTLSQALIGESVPPRQRGRYQAYLAGVFMAASTFGPVVGGYLTQHLGWPSVFLINLPIGILAMFLASLLPVTAASVKPEESVKLDFDFKGTAFFAGFITALLLAIEQVKQFSLEGLPEILLLAGLAGLALWFLLRQEHKSKTPLLPLDFLALPAIWRTNVMAAMVGAALVSTISFMPIYMQVVRGTTPNETGLLMLPLTIGIAAGALITGRLVSKTGWTAIFPSFGLALVTAALAFTAYGIGHLPNSRLPILFLCISVPFGTAMPVVQTIVQSVAGPKLLGSAAASVQLSRSIGAAIGTALVGTVLFFTLLRVDPNTAALLTSLIEQGPKALAGFSPERYTAVQTEIAAAFRAAFTTIAGFAAIGCVMAWIIPVRRI